MAFLPSVEQIILTMSNHIRVLTVLFNTVISSREIPLFRGAVLHALGEQANLLYHNHTGEHTFRYAYPLIQYKRIQGKAAIICIEEAIDTLVQLLKGVSGPIQLGRREAECEVVHIYSSKEQIQINDHFTSYRLLQWLPLNSNNYSEYQQADGILQKVQLLEHVLTGNILSFLKGVDIHIEEQLEVRITDILEQRPATYKGVPLMAFGIEFKTNLSIPQNIGLGKSVSVGYGTLTKITH